MAQTDAPFLLGLLLLTEGIAFGTFLTSGQAFVAEFSTPATRGTAVGVYGTAGSLGSTLSPVVLGVIAEIWGVSTVFRVTGALIMIGLLGIAGLFLWQRRAKRVQAPSQERDSQAGNEIQV
jgi:MFS family permease